MKCSTAKSYISSLHSFTGRECGFMLETQQRGCKTLQTDGTMFVVVTQAQSATTKVLMHLAVFSENSLADVWNMITGFCMKIRLMLKSQ